MVRSRITQSKRRGKARQGALLSAEMLIVAPVLMVIVFGMVETSLLISTYNQLKHASSVGCRSCSIASGVDREAVVLAIRAALNDEKLIGAVQVTCDDSGVSGEICRVTIQMPMSEAAPDLLAVLGFHLEGTLEASTAMRKE
ncbi:MAG: TadE/TadG family type IV pilus assembly protein [Planctomycetota bacterium]